MRDYTSFFGVCFMKTWKSWVIACVVLLIVGYSAFWYYQAHLLKSFAEERRGEVERAPGQETTFTFDRIETSGYPFSIKLSFANPHVNCSLKSKDVACDLALDGTMTQVFSLFGQLKKMTTDGKLHIAVQGNDQKPIFDGVANGKITLQSKFTGYLWSAIRHPFSTHKSDFEDIDFLISNLQFAFSLQGKKVGDLQIKDTEFLYQSQPDSQTINVTSDFVLDTSASSPFALSGFRNTDTASAFAPFFAIFEQVVEKQKGEKTNCSVDLKIELPSMEVFQKMTKAPLTLLFSTFPTFSINLKKLNFSSLYGSSEHSGYFTISEDSSKQVSIKFANDLKIKYTDAYYTKAMEITDDLAKAVKADLQPANEDLVRVKSLFLTNLDDLKALIPKLQQVGTISWTGKGFVDVNKTNFNFTSNLTDFGFRDDLYGILLNMDAKRNGKDMFCKVSIDCINYRALFQDLIAYFNRFIVVSNLLREQSAHELHPVSQETTQKVLSYLALISDAPGSTSPDLKITFSYDNGKIRVGTLDFEPFTVYLKDLMNTLSLDVYPTPIPLQQNVTK